MENQNSKFVENGRSWQDKTALVVKCALLNMEIDQIVQQTQVPEHQVKRILSEREVKRGMRRIEDRVVRETFADKIPILKEITGLSLVALREALLELHEPGKRQLMISSMRDLQALAKVALDANTLLRLESGESTENISTISHSYQETRHVIQDLQKIDPIFQYPELPKPEEQTND